MNKQLATAFALFGILQLAVFGCGGSGGGGGGSTSQSTSSMPRLVSAAAPSTHYVDVRFAGALPADGIEVARYQITAPDSSKLAQLSQFDR